MLIIWSLAVINYTTVYDVITDVKMTGNATALDINATKPLQTSKTNFDLHLV